VLPARDSAPRWVLRRKPHENASLDGSRPNAGEPLFWSENQGFSRISQGNQGPLDWFRRACPGCGLEGFQGLKIQYQPDSGRPADRLSMELPQREGDGRQALVTSPLLPNACRLPDSSPTNFGRVQIRLIFILHPAPSASSATVQRSAVRPSELMALPGIVLRQLWLGQGEQGGPP